MSLAEFQDAFAEALNFPEPPRKEALKLIPEFHGIPAIADQFKLYRNGVHRLLAKRLNAIFPTIFNIVGADFFLTAVADFQRIHPLSGSESSEFANNFPDFLDEYEPALSYPYLPDVAMLDLGHWKSYNARDCKSIQPKLFTELSPESLAQCRVKLHPSCYWFSSQYAIYHIWKLYHSNSPPAHIDHRLPQDVIIIRPKMTVEVHEIDTGFIKVLDTLDDGETLQQAFNEGSVWDSNFNTIAAIQFLVQNGLIAELL